MEIYVARVRMRQERRTHKRCYEIHSPNKDCELFAYLPSIYFTHYLSPQLKPLNTLDVALIIDV